MSLFKSLVNIEKTILPIVFLITCVFLKNLSNEDFYRLWTPIVMIIFVLLIILSCYRIGGMAFFLFDIDNGMTGPPSSIKIGIGLIVFILWAFIISLFHALFFWIALVPVLFSLYTSNKILRSFTLKSFSVDHMCSLALVGLVILFLVLSIKNILQMEFQIDSIDVYQQYLPAVNYTLKTGGLDRHYFLSEWQINPRLFSTLLYSFIACLSNIQILSFFSISLIVISGLCCYQIAKRLTTPPIALFAPAVFFLSFRQLYLVDMGANILKYNHILSMLIVPICLHLVLDAFRGQRSKVPILCGVLCGILLGEFSPGFLLLIPCMLCYFLFHFFKSWYDKGFPERIPLLSFLFSTGIVTLMPAIINTIYCGTPFEPVNSMELFGFHPPFLAYPEYYNVIEDYISNHYWKIGAIQYGFGENISSFISSLINRVFYLLPFLIGIGYTFLSVDKSEKKYYSLLIAPSILVFIFFPLYHYKARYQLPMLPILATLMPFFIESLLSYFSRWRLLSIYAKRKFTVCTRYFITFLTAYSFTAFSGYLPTLQSFAGSIYKSLTWLSDSYPYKHRNLSTAFYDSNIYSFIDEKVEEDEKIIINLENGPYTYLADRIVLAYYNYPFYSIFERDKKLLVKKLDQLNIRYILLFEGQSFIAPWKPLILDSYFALNHLELVAHARLNRYLQNEEYFMNFFEGKEQTESFEPFHNAYLLKISNENIKQSPNSKRVIQNLLSSITIKDVFNESIKTKIESLEIDEKMINRLKEFDIRIMNSWCSINCI